MFIFSPSPCPSFSPLIYSFFLETYAERPQTAHENELRKHRMVHQKLIQFYNGFKSDAHPMSIMVGCGSVARLSCWCAIISWAPTTFCTMLALPHHFTPLLCTTAIDPGWCCRRPLLLLSRQPQHQGPRAQSHQRLQVPVIYFFVLLAFVYLLAGVGAWIPFLRESVCSYRQLHPPNQADCKDADYRRHRVQDITRTGE
jgi:hypothetical protein